jgi:hypothetical protein
MSFKLIDNWRRAWRMATVQIATAAVAWGSLPEDTQASILDFIGVPEQRVPAILGVLLIVARLIDQPHTREPKK